jgi:hypothetical protein
LALQAYSKIYKIYSERKDPFAGFVVDKHTLAVRNVVGIRHCFIILYNDIFTEGAGGFVLQHKAVRIRFL